jgi:hypothetical protein
MTVDLIKYRRKHIYFVFNSPGMLCLAFGKSKSAIGQIKEAITQVLYHFVSVILYEE